MRAIVVEHHFEPGCLQEVPVPEPGDREILVKITVAGVNPIDWKQRDLYQHAIPFTLGQDFAGIVAATGDKAFKYRIDDRVFGIARARGAYADYTIVPEDENAQPVAKIPFDVGDADAAGLPTPALTALACVERVKVRSGHRVFVAGITGAVGQFAAQMVRDRGAVLAGSGRAAKADLARSLGAEVYAGYDRDDVVERVCAQFPDGVDAVIDVANDAGGTKVLARIVRRGGSYVSTIGAVDPAFFRERGIDAANVNLAQSPQSSHEALREIARMVEEGRLRVPLVAERDLVDAIPALDLVKAGGVDGKVVLAVEPPKLLRNPP